MSFGVFITANRELFEGYALHVYAFRPMTQDTIEEITVTASVGMEAV